VELLTKSPAAAVSAPQTSQRRAWPLVVVALAVFGGVATGVALTRGEDPPRQGRIGSAAAPQPDLHYVLGAAPGSWVASNAGDTIPAESSWAWQLWGDYQTSMYGTTDDPSAPAMILAVGDQVNSGGFAGVGTQTNLTRWTTNGTKGTCLTDGAGVRRCLVDVGGTQVQSHSSGLDGDALQAALETLRVRDGVPELDVAALPPSMTHLGSWTNRMPSVLGENGDAIVSRIQYHGPDNALALLAVGRADEHDMATAFDVGADEPIIVNGVTYFHGPSESGLLEFIAWERDEKAFLLIATPDKGVDLIDLATSVRPATRSEWATAVSATRPSFPASTAATDS